MGSSALIVLFGTQDRTHGFRARLEGRLEAESPQGGTGNVVLIEEAGTIEVMATELGGALLERLQRISAQQSRGFHVLFLAPFPDAASARMPAWTEALRAFVGAQGTLYPWLSTAGLKILAAIPPSGSATSSMLGEALGQLVQGCQSPSRCLDLRRVLLFGPSNLPPGVADSGVAGLAETDVADLVLEAAVLLLTTDLVPSIFQPNRDTRSVVASLGVGRVTVEPDRLAVRLARREAAGVLRRWHEERTSDAVGSREVQRRLKEQFRLPAGKDFAPAGLADILCHPSMLESVQPPQPEDLRSRLYFRLDEYLPWAADLPREKRWDLPKQIMETAAERLFPRLEQAVREVHGARDRLLALQRERVVDMFFGWTSGDDYVASLGDVESRCRVLAAALTEARAGARREIAAGWASDYDLLVPFLNPSGRGVPRDWGRSPQKTDPRHYHELFAKKLETEFVYGAYLARSGLAGTVLGQALGVLSGRVDPFFLDLWEWFPHAVVAVVPTLFFGASILRILIQRREIRTAQLQLYLSLHLRVHRLFETAVMEAVEAIYDQLLLRVGTPADLGRDTLFGNVHLWGEAVGQAWSRLEGESWPNKICETRFTRPLLSAEEEGRLPFSIKEHVSDPVADRTVPDIGRWHRDPHHRPLLGLTRGDLDGPLPDRDWVGALVDGSAGWCREHGFAYLDHITPLDLVRLVSRDPDRTLREAREFLDPLTRPFLHVPAAQLRGACRILAAALDRPPLPPESTTAVHGADALGHVTPDATGGFGRISIILDLSWDDLADAGIFPETSGESNERGETCLA